MFITIGKAFALVSALSGAVGTGLLFKGSFAYESPAFWADDAMLNDMRDRNRHRQLLQRTGLGLLMFSFALAGVSVLLD